MTAPGESGRGASRVGVALVALFAVLAVGVVAVLRQTSMFVGGSGPSHEVTELVVHVSSRGHRSATDVEARHLWSACKVNVPGEDIAISVSDGTIRASLVPALGQSVQRRFVGCLQDLTLPTLLGQVLSAKAVPEVARHGTIQRGRRG